MKSLKFGLLLALAMLATAGALAQTTTYTGTIKDLAAHAVTSGQVTFTLAPAVDSTVPGVARFSPTTIPCNINSDGTLSGYVAGVVSGACIVINNTALSPAGTSYRVCIQPQYAAPGSCFYDFALGGSKDISTVVPTLSTGPINYGMFYPPIGIANSLGTSWGPSYNALNLIPASFLPKATSSLFGIVKPDGTTCTITAGVFSCPGGVFSFNTRVGAVTLTAGDVNGVGSITNSTSGNAATATVATALAGTPSLCSTGQAPTGVDANGNAQACAPLGATGARTCNANGCYTLAPDGTLHQSGHSTSASGGTAGTVTITFPTAFSTTTNLEVVVSAVGEPTGDGNPHPLDCHISSGPTTSGASAVIAIPAQVGGSGYASLSGQVCSWHADGH